MIRLMWQNRSSLVPGQGGSVAAIEHTPGRARTRYVPHSIIPRSLKLLLICAAATGSLSPSIFADALEEVLVTASKREQDANRVGIPLIALSEEDLNQYRISAADEISNVSPNLSLNKSYGNSNAVLVVRGVGLQDYNVNNSPSVGVYINEVYLPTNAMADFAVYDLERVELMKGPQGVLWGRNATGGALNFVTRKPEHERSGEFTVGYANYATSNVRGAIGGELTPHTAARVAGIYERRKDGPFFSRALDKRVGDSERWGIRGSLVWEPSSQTEVLLLAETDNRTADSYPFSHVGVVGTDCPISTSPPGEGVADETRCTNTTTGYSDPDGNPYAGDWGIIPRTRIKSKTAVVRVDAELGAGHLTSITAGTELDFARGEDDDTSPDPLLQILYDSDISSLSQELRWSHGSGRFRWLLGAAGSRHDHSEYRIASLVGLFGTLLEDIQLRYEQRSDAVAAFADATWQTSGRTALHAGVRWTMESLSFNGGARPGPGQFVPEFVAIVFPGLPSIVDLERAFDNYSGRISLDFQYSKALLLYATLSKGFKSGGVFGGFGLAPVAFTPYDPEELYALEAGIKFQDRPRHIRLEASAFYYDYRDVQGQILVHAGTGSVPQLGNVGEARVIGLEILSAWDLSARLEATLGLGLLSTELRDETEALDSIQRPLSLKGKSLPHAPRRSANAAIQYRIPLRSSFSILLVGDVSYRSAYYNDLPNQEHLRQHGSVTLLGGRLALSTQDDNWEVALWGHNLTDQRYLLHGNSSGIGNDLLMHGEPRTYGIEAILRW